VSGLLDALMRVHLACDAVAMVAFWVAAVSAKGGRAHRVAGRWFMRVVYAAGATGGVVAVVSLVSPLTVRPAAVELAGAAQADVLTAARQSMWLVLYILVILVAPVHHGLAVIRAGPSPPAVRSTAHTLIALLAIGSSLALAVASLRWAQWTYLVVAPIGLVVGLGHLRYRLRTSATPLDWQREHLTSVLTAGIVLHTALLVFGSSRTLGLSLVGPIEFVPWVLPALVGLPVIVLLRRRWH
jgi:hypothetical protein